MTALRWEDVDFNKNILHIKRTVDFRAGKWEFRTTKTKSGRRDIPLTQEAIDILKEQKKNTFIKSNSNGIQ